MTVVTIVVIRLSVIERVASALAVYEGVLTGILIVRIAGIESGAVPCAGIVQVVATVSVATIAVATKSAATESVANESVGTKSTVTVSGIGRNDVGETPSAAVVHCRIAVQRLPGVVSWAVESVRRIVPAVAHLGVPVREGHSGC